MADFGSPVVNTTYDPTAGIRTISGLLGVQQQQAGVQTARAQAQAAQQQMAERAAFTNMLKTGVDDQGNPIRTPDGDVDPAKVVAAQGRIAPIYGSEWSSGIIKAHADKVGLQSALQSLDANGPALIAGPMRAFGLHPSDANLATKRDTIAGLVQDHPELGATAKHAGAMLDQVGSVPDTPQNAGQRSMMASRFSAQFQTKQPVATQWTGQDIDTGPNVQSGVKAPPAAGGGGAPATSTPHEGAPRMRPRQPLRRPAALPRPLLHAQRRAPRRRRSRPARWTRTARPCTRRAKRISSRRMRRRSPRTALRHKTRSRISTSSGGSSNSRKAASTRGRTVRASRTWQQSSRASPASRAQRNTRTITTSSSSSCRRMPPGRARRSAWAAQTRASISQSTRSAAATWTRARSATSRIT